MKNSGGPRRRLFTILLTILLAAGCVGGVELWVCSYQEPDLYAAITAPAREAVRRAGEAGTTAWRNLSRLLDAAVAEGSARLRESLQRPKEPPEQDEGQQLTDDSTVKAPPKPRADFTVTALAARDGREYLTGGAREVVYYNQTAEAWADEPYGSDNIGRYGCGPTAMAMAVSTLTDNSIDPAQMAQHCVDEGYWAKKNGSYWSIVPGVAEDYGLSCTSLPLEEAEEEDISLRLATGQLLVVMMGPGHFTDGGHFILLRGVTLEGGILVADPASPERSLTVWDLELILSELSSGRSSGGPLWVLSPGQSD